MTRFLERQAARAKRIRTMDSAAIREKLAGKFSSLFSYRNNIRRLTHALENHSARLFPDEYRERPEGGPTNLQTKLARKDAGGPFEPWSVALINRAALQLIGECATILEVGCGTAMFASEAAARNPRITITASELDEATLKWARENRPAPNIFYCPLRLEECATDQFDLAVALEVIEHLFDFAGFLSALSRVAPRALISTPNKNRFPFTAIANTPAYSEHVREWTAGEFFWVLRCFYDKVELFTLPRFAGQVRAFAKDAGYVPEIKKCGVLEREEPLIAVCSRPRRN